MSGVATILEQIRPLVRELSAEERLILIRSIAQIDTVHDSDISSGVTATADTQQVMLAEQEAWFNQPASERAQYRGQYIAIHHGVVIDHDSDRSTLLRRVRDRFGNTPIPIISGDDDFTPEYVIRSPYLIR